MANKKDLKNLGEVYGSLGKETSTYTESVHKLVVGDEESNVGDAKLTDGGGTEAAGVKETEVDVKKVGKDENPYNVKGLSYGDDNCPTHGTDQPQEVKAGDDEKDDETPEEDEESHSKELEIARVGLNKYMAKKSIFDELYAKVISEDFGMEEVDDLDALGIDNATPDSELADDDAEAEGDTEEVTITLDKELAKTLCDLIKAAVGEEEVSDDVDGEEVDTEEGEHSEPEEDNEGAPAAHTTHVDMGTSNKVGSVDGLGGHGAGTADGGKTADKHSAAVKDGKSNKVGNLSQGQAAFGDVKVTKIAKA
tara:strand:- start:901 stop:1824 length:924 start_codon:yes stop_codon:yes gene_type:complete